MTTTLIALALIGLLAYALERNRRRQPPGPRPPLAGSSDIRDRDAERVYADLVFVPDTEPSRRPSGGRADTTRAVKSWTPPRSHAPHRRGAAHLSR